MKIKINLLRSILSISSTSYGIISYRVNSKNNCIKGKIKSIGCLIFGIILFIIEIDKNFKPLDYKDEDYEI